MRLRNASMSAAGVHGSAVPKIASVGHIAAATVERLDRVAGPLPALGRAQHAVERDRGVEAIGRGGLERVVAAHAEPEHRHPRHVVFDDEQVRRRRRDLRAARRRRAASPAPCAPRSSRLLGRRRVANGSTAHTAKPMRREAPRHVVEQRPEPTDVGMQHDARHAACRRAARARSARRPRRRRASASRPRRRRSAFVECSHGPRSYCQLDDAEASELPER